ncbi:hypothetical protein QCA50_013046 [Cerrena zonata]|uniref:Aminoglycoside phosphotransferase domain-containing protein n=1 Tax=Cerrena zonata TaxID=2478898 RepID=A0AAW0FQU6_9APHY
MPEWFLRLRVWIYHILSQPVNSFVRIFRFGLPFVLKKSEGYVSTEADALRFLNSQFRGKDRLPIPKLYDVIAIDGVTYTLMSKLPGQSIADAGQAGRLPFTTEFFDSIAEQVEAILRRVWALEQPPHIRGQVMVSASGHGVLTDYNFRHGLLGPCTVLDYYALAVGYANGESLVRDYPEAEHTFPADRIVFTHTDPHLQNTLISDDGCVCGLVDWENAGWFPMVYQWQLLRAMHGHTKLPYRQAWGRLQVSDETRAARTLFAKIRAATPR